MEGRGGTAVNGKGTFDDPWVLDGGPPPRMSGWYFTSPAISPQVKQRWCEKCDHWCDPKSGICDEWCPEHQ